MIALPLGSGLHVTLCIAQGQRGRAECPLNQDKGALVLVLTLPFTTQVLSCHICENGAGNAVPLIW